MRLKLKSGEKSKSFKLKDVVAMQVGKMDSVKDIRSMEPSKDSEEFCLDCLKTINSFFSDVEITKQNLLEPNFKHFRDSCNREWHMLKSKNPFLRSYYYCEKGWIKLKVDGDTPKEIFDKLGIQSKDRIMLRIDKHNDRLNSDRKLIGIQPSGYLS
jgi:hypothetical protein|tara:strand:- start:86 stop:553 length:468 start_codon:yes stop_codon:yes gene_type:complete